MGLRRHKHKQIHNKTEREYTYGEFLLLISLCSEQEKERLNAELEGAQRPSFINGKQVPSDLNHISYGTLDDISSAREDTDPFVHIMEILLRLTPQQVYNLNVWDVVGFGKFVTEQIGKINDLFASLKVDYSAEEKAAGVESLNFGSFGVLDWYARRMGITNQNDVRDVAWIRIYNCMRNDVMQNNYERRLHKQATQKIKKR